MKYANTTHVIVGTDNANSAIHDMKNAVSTKKEDINPFVECSTRNSGYCAWEDAQVNSRRLKQCAIIS